MVSEKDRMIEWLNRCKEQVQTISTLNDLRSNYDTISVLTKVAEGKAYMKGIAPLKRD